MAVQVASGRINRTGAAHVFLKCLKSAFDGRKKITIGNRQSCL
jgi:hypothetical protein